MPKTQNGGRKSIQDCANSNLIKGALSSIRASEVKWTPSKTWPTQQLSSVKRTPPKTSPKQHEIAWVPLVWSTNKQGNSFEVDRVGGELTDSTMSDLIAAMKGELNFYYPRGTKHESIVCTMLNLSLNKVGDSDIAQLAAFFIEAGISVRSFRLFKNEISDNGALALCNMIAASPEPLHELHLSHNRITWRGALALFEAVADSCKYPYTVGNKQWPFWLRLEWNSIDWLRVFRNLRAEHESMWDSADKRNSPHVLSHRCIAMHSSYQNQSLECAEDTLNPDGSLQNKRQPVAASSENNQLTTSSGHNLKWRVKAMPAEQPEAEPVPADPAQEDAVVNCTTEAATPGREQAKAPTIAEMVAPQEPGHSNSHSGTCCEYSRVYMLSVRHAMTQSSLDDNSVGLHAGPASAPIEHAKSEMFEAKQIPSVDNSMVRRSVNKIPKTEEHIQNGGCLGELRAPELMLAAAADKRPHVDSLSLPNPPMPRLLGKPPGTWFGPHAAEIMPTKSAQNRRTNEVSYIRAASKAGGDEDEGSEQHLYMSQNLEGLASVQLLYQTLGVQQNMPR